MNWLKKNLGTIIASVLTGLLVLVGNWYISPASDLVAEIEYGSFMYPPGLVDSLKLLRNLAYESRLKEIDLEDDLKPISDNTEREITRLLIMKHFSSYLSENLPLLGIPEPFYHLKGYYSVTLRNEGNKSAKSVTLTLPNIVYMCIDREGEERKCNKSSEVVKIDDFRPHEAISVIAWSRHEPPPYLHISDRILLTHESGVGSVVIRAPIGPFWHGLARFLKIFWIPILFFMYIFSVVFIYWNKRRKAEPDPSDSQSETDSK